MARVLALLAAIAMVAASFAVRSAWDDDGDGGAADGPPGRLVCDLAFEDACRPVAEQLDRELVVETLAASVSRLGAGPVSAGGADPRPEVEPRPGDVWVTAAAAPVIVGEARARAGLAPLMGPAEPVAHARLGLVGWSVRLERLEPCPDAEPGWGCVAEAAGRPWTEVGGDATWGMVKPTHLSPDDTALGLVTLGQVGAALLGRSDFSATDLDDPAFADPFRRLERAAPSFPSSPRAVVDTLAVRGPASLDVAGLPEPAAERAVALAGDRFGGLSATYAPGGAEVRVQLVAVPLSPGASVPAEVVEALTATLVDAGWEAGEVQDDGLPAAGVLEALRIRWREVTR